MHCDVVRTRTAKSGKDAGMGRLLPKLETSKTEMKVGFFLGGGGGGGGESGEGGGRLLEGKTLNKCCMQMPPHPTRPPC